MLKNYALITLRNLFRNKVYSFINVAGLSIGLACSLLIFLWVQDETSFDTFHPKADRLYQVWINAKFDGEINSWNSVPLPTAEAMKTADSHIQNATVTNWGGEYLLTVGERPITQRGYYAGSEFLEMFEFPLIQGEATTVLDEPYSIVITQSTAKALFGSEDPVGQIIRLSDEHDLKVTGVLEDVPANSSFEFDFLVPWSLSEQTSDQTKRDQDNWGNYSYQAYVELRDPSYLADVNNSIRGMLIEHDEKDLEQEFFLYPLLRWRLHASFENGVEEGGMADYVRLFTVIAVFILLIACINFMNLATARSERRAREVGIRKSVGSSRRELVAQFMGESIFISVIAFLVAVLLTELALPFYNELVDKELSIDYTSGAFWLASLGVILLTGIVAGSYPALYLSSFQPVKVLKGKVKAGKNASTPRQVLVVLQFGFAILLIVGTIVIYQQIQLVQSRELGYEQENLISVRRTTDLEKNYEVLKNELLQSGTVEAVTRSNSDITQINSNNFVGWPGKPEEQRVLFVTIVADYDYTKTMGIEVLQGRDFSKDFSNDTASIIINQAALDIMQLDDPIGTQLDLWDEKRTLIGVVDNVLMGSPYEPVRPMFVILDDWGGSITLRLAKTDDLPGTLARVEDVFKKYNPAYPFEYEFMDEEFQKKYVTINLTKQLANLFMALALIITGLGLFGLASYTAEQRNKEIGIRKVLGASVLSIIALMSKDFSRLVIIAFVIATPLAWWALNTYLERYEIRTDVHWWIFPLTGAIALVFALVFVVGQALRAAQGDPVKALRSE
jgi:predicted permease